MKNYSDQIERIKSKLLLAKKADKSLKVFGASSHQYSINKPATIDDILVIEKKYAIHLPDCYKAFILQFGNGGTAYANSGAGPFYGIYPLGEYVDELIDENTEKYLKNNCILYPKMTDQDWENITLKIEDDAISDDDYTKELGRIYGGILPIGSQGCTYLHGLVLNGEHRGKVVNLSLDHYKPIFTFENNFLDWYERWLDEVISGDLLIDSPTWFGYSMGGTEKQLLESFHSNSNNTTGKDALIGLLKKREITPATLHLINQAYTDSNNGNSQLLLQILAKHQHDTWKEYVIELGKNDLLTVFKYIFWYDKPNYSDWKEFINANISHITDSETFRFCTYILQECQFDYGSLIKNFIKHQNEEIRSTTIYSLGKLSNKEDYLDIFIIGLNDTSQKVIHSSLQALSGIKKKSLLVHYKNIADRLPVEKNYILSNLKNRLKEFNISLKWLRENDPSIFSKK